MGKGAIIAYDTRLDELLFLFLLFFLLFRCIYQACLFYVLSMLLVPGVRGGWLTDNRRAFGYRTVRNHRLCDTLLSSNSSDESCFYLFFFIVLCWDVVVGLG